ncbi:TPA: TcfC E-set like domain-containing protein [Photobacterium damselae]
MNKLKYFIVSILFANKSFSMNVPSGFEEMYKFSNQTLEVQDIRSHRDFINFYVNYNTIKINNRNIDSFSNYLKNIGVKNDTIHKIINDLTSSEGVESTDKCNGEIGKCIVVSNDYDLLLDYDKKRLFVYFSPENLDILQEKKEYVSNIDMNPALINSSDIFLGYSSKLSFTLNDNTILGMKYGNIESDFTYSTTNYFESHKLAYILDYDKYQLQVGLFDGNLDTNATGVLMNHQDNKELSINISSSKNLLKNDDSSYKVLDFYSPSNGVLSIEKDNRIILQRTVTAGSGEIPYSQLPSGVYSIQLSIKSNGQNIVNQEYQIYNIKGNHLSKKEVDFLFSSGVYKDDLDDEDNISFKDSPFIRTLYAYGLSAPLTIAGGGELTKNNNFSYSFGSSYLFTNGSVLNFIYSGYNKSSTKKTLNLFTPWLLINYDEVSLSNDDDYAKYMEGDYSRKSISISKNFNLSSNLSSGIYYNYYMFDSNKKNESWNVSTNLDYRFLGDKTLSSRLMYQSKSSEFSKDDELSIYLSLTIPLNDQLYYTGSITADESKLNEVRNELSYEIVNKNGKNLSITAANSYVGNTSNKNISSISTSGYWNNEYIDSNIYTYTNTYGEHNANLSLSNTQVLSSKDIQFTSQKSKSYLNVDVEQNDRRLKNLGLLTINKNKKQYSELYLYKKRNIIPLDEYEQYSSDIDTDSVSLENYGDKKLDLFSLPGSVYTIKPKVGKVVSFIAAFNDIFDNKINEINCNGDGCVSTEQIDDNVFSVKVRSGSEFILTSNNLVCLTPSVRNIRSLNIGLNHCVPNIDDIDNNEILLSDAKGIMHRLFYLGIYDKSASDDYRSKFKNYKIIEQELNESENLVYISTDEKQQIAQDDKLMLKKIIMTADNTQLRPFVLNLDQSWFKTDNIDYSEIY